MIPLISIKFEQKFLGKLNENLCETHQIKEIENQLRLRRVQQRRFE